MPIKQTVLLESYEGSWPPDDRDAGFRQVVAEYSGSDALLEMGPRVVRQMDDIVREAEASGTDEARLKAYAALKAIVSWLQVPLDDPEWRAGGR
jgi:hypothetical protein